MYSTLCTAKSSKVGRIHGLLRRHGLHPLARNPRAQTTNVGDDPCVTIELPEDEIEKGREVLKEGPA
jgi:hypothetical protein